MRLAGPAPGRPAPTRLAPARLAPVLLGLLVVALVQLWGATAAPSSPGGTLTVVPLKVAPGGTLTLEGWCARVLSPDGSGSPATPAVSGLSSRLPAPWFRRAVPST